jgi:hypothetical protein
MHTYHILILITLCTLLAMCFLARWHVEGFALANSTTFYDNAESRYNQIRANYLNTLNKENVIESNPWIFIGDTRDKPSGYPIESLGRLTDSNPTRLERDPRSYYEFDEVTYTGLPLPY